MLKSNPEIAQNAQSKLRSVVAKVESGQKKLFFGLCMALGLIIILWFYGIFSINTLIQLPLFSKAMLLISPLCLVLFIGLYLHRRLADFLHQRQVLLLLAQQQTPTEEANAELAQMIETAKTIDQELELLARYTSVDNKAMIENTEAVILRLNESISAQLERHAEFQQIIQETSEKIIEKQTERLSFFQDGERQFHQIVDRMEQDKQNLNDFGQGLVERTVAFDAFSEKITHLQQQCVALEETVAQSVKKIAEDNDPEMLTKLPDRLSEQTQKLSEILGSANTLFSADSEVLNKFLAMKTDMAAMLEGFQTQKQAFQAELDRLVAAGESLKDAHTTLRDQHQQAGRDVFLKSAQYVLQDLHASAMDIVRNLDGTISEDDWKRFSKGDRGIFTRKLLKHPLDQLSAELELRMINDTELQNFVYRFVHEFERLLGSTDDLDPEGFLYALLISSDIGKLALLLKKALGK